MSDPGGNRLIVRRVKQIVECSVVLSQCNFTDNLSVHGDFLCVLLTDDRQTSNDDHCKGRKSGPQPWMQLHHWHRHPRVGNLSGLLFNQAVRQAAQDQLGDAVFPDFGVDSP